MAFATPSSDASPRRERPQPAPSARASVPRQAGQQYRRAQVETASPTGLVVLLYDGAIRFCALALEAMSHRGALQINALQHDTSQRETLQTNALQMDALQIDIETQNTNLLKAQRIVAELMGSLDREAGGDMAGNLFAVYAHILEQLVHANLYDDVDAVQGVQAHLLQLREAWLEVDRLASAGTLPPAGQGVLSEAVSVPVTSERTRRVENAPAPAPALRATGARMARLHAALSEKAVPSPSLLREQSA